MAKAWRNLLDINECAAGWYDPNGVAMSDADITAAGLTATAASGTVTLGGTVVGTYYYRLTPNHGVGMGASDARIAIESASNVSSASPRWDAATGTWPAFTSPGSLEPTSVEEWSYIEIPLAVSSNPGEVVFSAEAYFEEVATASYNYNCTDSEGSYRTLSEVRGELMARLGFGNQVANPPPGLATTLDSFLRQAQRQLWERFTTLRRTRFYSWPLIEGVRLYGLLDTAESCDKVIDPDTIIEVGVYREGSYSPLVAGIRPTLRYYIETTGRPTYYDLRSCVEVWPVPDSTEGSLVIKAGAKPGRLTEDTDTFSVDDDLVLTLALARAKAHWQQPDAQNYQSDAEVLLANLVAGSHTTKVYIPGRRRDEDMIYVQPKPSTPFTS